MKLSASDVRFGPFLSRVKSYLSKKMAKKLKLEFALGQIVRKNLEERQVLVDKIQAIKRCMLL